MHCCQFDPLAMRRARSSYRVPAGGASPLGGEAKRAARRSSSDRVLSSVEPVLAETAPLPYHPQPVVRAVVAPRVHLPSSHQPYSRLPACAPGLEWWTEEFAPFAQPQRGAGACFSTSKAQIPSMLSRLFAGPISSTQKSRPPFGEDCPEQALVVASVDVRAVRVGLHRRALLDPPAVRGRSRREFMQQYADLRLDIGVSRCGLALRLSLCGLLLLLCSSSLGLRTCAVAVVLAGPCDMRSRPMHASAIGAAAHAKHRNQCCVLQTTSCLKACCATREVSGSRALSCASCDFLVRSSSASPRAPP